jgi:ATP-dependent DNA helicase RecQ
MPGTLEAYYQEAGRAGRDGKPAEAILLHAFRDRFTHEFFIKTAHPERGLVAALYEKLQRGADREGRVEIDSSYLSRVLPDKPTPRDVEAAVRLLQSRGAVIASSNATTTVSVRLLATPERIKSELGEGAAMELSFLRSLWRLVGKRINDGAIVDTSGFPPGYGSARDVMALLDGLQARQFLVWTPTESSTRLARPDLPLDFFRIDWAAMERRRLADLGKLDAMQKYSYSNRCRRQFVLNYFGDPAARPRCKGCDNCLGIALAKRTKAAGKSRRRRR